MSERASDRLKAFGLDVQFLIWLEGPEDRLLQVHRLAELDDASIAAAVRAAVWLTSQWTNRDAVEADGMDAWKERYESLQAFLWNALRLSMIHHRLDRSKDLEALDEVLDILMPRSAAQVYRDDLLRLRKLGKPERLADWEPVGRKPRRGGRRQSETIQRMRAAVEYLQAASSTPYRDLADLWNESLGERQYDPEQIRQSLRKGEQAGAALLEFWRRIYRGEMPLGPR